MDDEEYSQQSWNWQQRDKGKQRSIWKLSKNESNYFVCDEWRKGKKRINQTRAVVLRHLILCKFLLYVQGAGQVLSIKLSCRTEARRSCCHRGGWTCWVPPGTWPTPTAACCRRRRTWSRTAASRSWSGAQRPRRPSPTSWSGPWASRRPRPSTAPARCWAPARRSSGRTGPPSASWSCYRRRPPRRPSPRRRRRSPLPRRRGAPATTCCPPTWTTLLPPRWLSFCSALAPGNLSGRSLPDLAVGYENWLSCRPMAKHAGYIYIGREQPQLARVWDGGHGKEARASARARSTRSPRRLWLQQCSDVRAWYNSSSPCFRWCWLMRKILWTGPYIYLKRTHIEFVSSMGATGARILQHSKSLLAILQKYI